MIGSMSKIATTHSISVVIPVFNGRASIAQVVNNLEPLTHESTTANGVSFCVSEIVLVFDCGTDGSEVILKELEENHLFVRVVWLMRNFGQHAATIAGMASTTSDWIVTLDEDCQQNPADIPRMLDTAMMSGSQIVYAKPTNRPPHGLVRNACSKVVKGPISRLLTNGEVQNFNSFRLILGEVGRTLAAYVGHGVYLDVALQWIAQKATTCDVVLMSEARKNSGYTRRTLLSHFWRLVLSSGTRLLRLASLVGVISFLGGLILAIGVILGKVFLDYPVTGWASVFVALLLFSGLTLLFLGVIAEYVGLLVRTTIGKPLYVIGSDPHHSALGRHKQL
jgi:undecaprenyl-phosphate 4-deoxy-4-formamido-L-arabinose transferase